MSRPISVAEFRAMIAKPRRNKYRVAAPTARTWNGKTYASKAEMLRAQWLAASTQFMEIVEQPRLWLGVRENVYVPDFLVIPRSGVPWYEDVKGVETTQFRKVKKLWAAYSRLPLRIIKLSKGVFEVVEIISPPATIRGQG